MDKDRRLGDWMSVFSSESGSLLFRVTFLVASYRIGYKVRAAQLQQEYNDSWRAARTLLAGGNERR